MSTTVVSAKLWGYLRLMFKCGSICHSHPYQWNEGLKRGELCPSKKQLAVWLLNVGMTAVYSIYLIVRVVQITFDEESSNIQKVYIKFILFWYSFPALFQTVIVVKKRDLPPFYGLNLTAVRIFEEHISNYDAEEHPEVAEEDEEEDDQHPPQPPRCLMPKLVDLFFDFLFCGFLSITCFIGLLNFVRPQSPEFISSFLAPNSGILRWLVILLSAMFQMYYECTRMINVLFLTYLGFGFGIPALIALVQIKGWLRADSDTIPQLKVQRILILYRSVQVIAKAYESVFCDILVPVSKGAMIINIIFCCYGAIRMEGFAVIFFGSAGVLGFGVLIPMLSAFALADSLSRETLQRMQEPMFQNSLTLRQKKEVKSLHAIQLRMRRGYILDKECVKTVYQIIVDRTIEMLLANR